MSAICVHSDMQEGAGAAAVVCLQHLLGKQAVLTGDDRPPRNERDWSVIDPVRPLAVVRPTDPQGVASTLRIASEYGIAVVPQGGLTGLAGGATPVEGALALSLERLVGVEEIDAAAATMTVRAGTALETIQRAAEDVGLFFALDLGSRGSCSIGGNISTNAGGNRVIRYGMMREMVLGLEVALPDGTLLTSLGKMLKNNAGYDLKQLFIGSEGTLGVITRAVLRLYPRPPFTSTALCGLATYETVLGLLSSARSALGPSLVAFEVMWADYWNLVTDRIPDFRRPIGGAHGFYVLVEIQGDESDQVKFEAWLEGLATAGLIQDAAIARSLADTKDFWRARDAAAEFKQVIGPHASFDLGLPATVMDAYAAACRRALAAGVPGCMSVYFGHVGDGNLHIVAWASGADAQPFEAIEEIVYGLVPEFGGSISAEHGIGTTKRPYLHLSRTPEELALMRVLKSAIDPRGILNPGKILQELASS